MAQVGDTYTDPAGALQTNINNLTAEVTSRINQAPQVQKSIGQAIQNTPTAYQPEATERGDLVKLLFQHDKELGARYSDPNNSMYIENPAARDAATYAPEAPVLGAINTRNANLSLLRSLFGDAISRAMGLYAAETESKQTQLSGLSRQLERLDQIKAQEEDKRRWEAQFALQKATAGGSAGGVDYSQVPVKTPNGVEMQWAKVDRKTGKVLEVLGKENQPDIATTLKKLREMSSGGGASTTKSLVTLKDPQSSKVFSYEGTADPDYIEDIGRGYVPQ
jgi:hypothetical protein